MYHDFKQTPRNGDCGKGVECGEYVFNHRNSSLRPRLINTFLGSSRYQHSQAWGNSSIPGQRYGSLMSPTQRRSR